MSDISKNSEAQFLLNGVQLNAPLEWEDIKITAQYDNDSIQPSLSIEEFSFPLDARDAVNQWIEDGINGSVGIFEGMPFQLTLFNNQPIQENFKAFLDFTKGYKDLPEDGKVEVSIIKDDSLDNFFEQIEGTTYGYLESIGAVGTGDYKKVKYVVEKKFNMFELLMSSVILYLMVKELIEAISTLVDAIANAIGHISGGISGSIAGAVYAVVKAIIILVYVIVILGAVIELAKKLLETLLPPEREHLVISLRDALRVVCTHFGYGFVSPIGYLDDVAFLPSNPNLDEKTLEGFISVVRGTQSGIPNVIDYGYKCDEMFKICKDLFNAKLSIINGAVHLRSKNDAYWLQQSTWNLPSTLLNTKEYNTDEIKPARILSFATDLNDDWTIDNYRGTSYEIRTSPLSVYRKRAVLLKGLDEILFRTALGNRKNGLNSLEKFLKEVAQFIDKVTGFFGGATNFADDIKGRIGVLKVSNNWHSIPKLIYLSGETLPSNHRDLWNSKVLYDNYHVEKSFVANGWVGQKIVYRGIRIPFGFVDYKQLTINSYFLFNGLQAKIIKFDWTIGTDTAEIDFWVRKPYTHNLKETYINPQ